MATKTRDERQFEKVMDQASKSDQQMVKMAERDAKRLEKEYLKSVKVGTQVSTVMTAQQKYISFQETQKAEKAMAKAAEKVTKCTKAMNKAEHSHKDVVAGREKAEKTLNVSYLGDHAVMSFISPFFQDKKQKQDLDGQDVQQRQMQLFDVHSTYDQNEVSRGLYHFFFCVLIPCSHSESACAELPSSIRRMGRPTIQLPV